MGGDLPIMAPKIYSLMYLNIKYTALGGTNSTSNIPNVKEKPFKS